MNKFRNAAIEILSEIKKPLHSKEITRLALEKGIPAFVGVSCLPMAWSPTYNKSFPLCSLCPQW